MTLTKLNVEMATKLTREKVSQILALRARNGLDET